METRNRYQRSFRNIWRDAKSFGTYRPVCTHQTNCIKKLSRANSSSCRNISRRGRKSWHNIRSCWRWGMPSLSTWLRAPIPLQSSATLSRTSVAWHLRMAFLRNCLVPPIIWALGSNNCQSTCETSCWVIVSCRMPRHLRSQPSPARMNRSSNWRSWTQVILEIRWKHTSLIRVEGRGSGSNKSWTFLFRSQCQSQVDISRICRILKAIKYRTSAKTLRWQSLWTPSKMDFILKSFQTPSHLKRG